MIQIVAFYFFFYFILGYSHLTNGVVIVSGEQGRDSAIHIHVSFLPQTPLPSRLPHNIEQSSLCYIVGLCWLSILNTEVYTCLSRIACHKGPFNNILILILIWESHHVRVASKILIKTNERWLPTMILSQNYKTTLALLLLLLIFKNWHIIDLLYCVSFRCTAKWFSYTFM